jgi:hypothetical protein
MDGGLRLQGRGSNILDASFDGSDEQLIFAICGQVCQVGCSGVKGVVEEGWSLAWAGLSWR